MPAPYPTSSPILIFHSPLFILQLPTLLIKLALAIVQLPAAIFKLAAAVVILSAPIVAHFTLPGVANRRRANLHSLAHGQGYKRR